MIGGRVIGGNDAQAHSWPWQIFLSFDEWDCGAIMIHPTWLLTAAHCVPGQKWKGRSGQLMAGLSILNKEMVVMNIKSQTLEKISDNHRFSFYA